MDIHFDGFQHTFPAFWMILLIFGALALSFWSYHRLENLSETVRWILTGLRTAAFLLLILLLLNPVITTREQRNYPLEIAVLFDNSKSTIIEKGGYEGEESYREVINRISIGDDDRSDRVSLDLYSFDAGLNRIGSTGDLDFEGTRTDIDLALAEFLDNLERQEAVILVTDGIVTSGREPSATASRYQIPIYTIAIGDTSRRNDIVVQRVAHNPSATVNSRIPVEAYILNDGFPDQDISVQLLREDDILDETTIRSSETRSIQRVPFELDLEEEGLQQFRIHVPEIEGEWTAENNTRYFSVNVRDDRLRILHLACEIHPDVRAFRSFLREDQQITLENRTWIGGDNYIEGDLPDRPDTLDLVILHGFPHSDLTESHAAEIADRFSENALLIAGSPGQEVTRLSSLFPGLLPLQFSSEYRWYETQTEIIDENRTHAILDFDLPVDLRMAPVRSGIRDVTLQGNSVPLLQTVYRGNTTGSPMLAVRTFGDRHTAHLNGYHFYRWSLGSRSETRDFWENILNNTVKWTAASPDEELLDLTPADPVFQIGEPVIINAFLRNESAEPEENGVIELDIENSDGQTRNYIMQNEGSGRYQLIIDNLPEGSYHYTGTASRDDREIDSRSGQFTVGGINRELINTIRNDELLRLLANLTGGVFLPYTEAGQLYDILEENLGFDERTEEVIHSVTVHRHPFWFILLILFLTLEWSLRKYYALS